MGIARCYPLKNRFPDVMPCTLIFSFGNKLFALHKFPDIMPCSLASLIEIVLHLGCYEFIAYLMNNIDQ